MTLTRIERVPPAETRLADDNAALLHAIGITPIYLVASSGAGKTSLLMRTVESLHNKVRLAIIQGTIALPTGPTVLDDVPVPTVLVDTGGQPYLDASMVREALDQLPLADIDLLLVEEIGALNAPLRPPLGKARRVVIASLPEGEECPLRYTDTFSRADAVVLNKIDLLPALQFDRGLFYRTLRRLNTAAPVFEVSCRTGEGLESWCNWLTEQI